MNIFILILGVSLAIGYWLASFLSDEERPVTSMDLSHSLLLLILVLIGLLVE